MVADLSLNQVICGDAVELMQRLPDDSIHAIVTDPPYGLEFMGEEWDSFRAKNVIKQTCGVMARKGFGALPSFSAKDNVKCPICGKWEYDHEGRKCECGGANLWSRLMFGGTYQLWTTAWAREALRVLKPGASMFVMGGTRTYHRMACGVEDAGFEIKDTILWCYNSGFPKSQDLGKMIDKRLGAEREIVGEKEIDVGMQSGHMHAGRPTEVVKVPITTPATSEAKKWNGWKVGGLKPSYEPIVWAIKPPESSYTDNVLKHGVGAVNVGGCRIPYESEDDIKRKNPHTVHKVEANYGIYSPYANQKFEISEQGRYPANMVRTDKFDDGYDKFYFVPKTSHEGRWFKCKICKSYQDGVHFRKHNIHALHCYECGVDFPNTEKSRKAHKDHTTESNLIVHPTVKPARLMEYLIKLVTRENQIVLDPFVGSGTTCVAARRLNRRYIGFDNNPEYIEIAKRRLAAIPKPLEAFT